MSTTSRERSSGVSSGPMRSAFAQSTATSTRSPTSSGNSRSTPSSSMKLYSRGNGASPVRSISTSLPSWRRASVVASSDPSASPSGFSCVTTRNFSLSLSAAVIAWRSLIFGGQLVDQAAHAHTALDRRIVFEGQLRGSLHSQLTRQPRLQQAVRCPQSAQRRRPLLLVPEHADVDRRVPEIGCGDDRGHGDEPDPRVLQLRQRLREDLPHRLVDPPHPLAHSGYSTDARTAAGGDRRLVLRNRPRRRPPRSRSRQHPAAGLP